MTAFAFIHGAGDVGWYWHLVEHEPQSDGHETLAPDLPVEDDTAGLAAYADLMVKAIGDRPMWWTWHSRSVVTSPRWSLHA